MSGPASGAPVELDVTPIDGPVDEVPPVLVRAAPGAEVSLSAETVDADGHPWRSEARFRAADDGTVDPARDAPLHAGWTGVDPSGPWWSMVFTDESLAPVAFTASADAITCRLTATSDGAAATVEVVRRWAPSAPTTVRGDGWLGLCFDPPGSADDASPRPGVVVVPGSTGPAAMAPMAGLLATHGFRTMVLAYQQEDGLPPTLREIPVERLQDGIATFAGRADVSGVAVVSVSVGTGGALLALAHDGPEVAAAVAVAPTSVVWQALAAAGPPPKAPSWTVGGQPLPYVPVHGEKLLPELVRHAVGSWLHRHPRPRALHMLGPTAPAWPTRTTSQRRRSRWSASRPRCCWWPAPTT